MPRYITAYDLGQYAVMLKKSADTQAPKNDGMLLGGLIGAGLGGLHGLLLPHTTEEIKNGKRVLKSHRLSSALSRGLLGGATGAIIGNKMTPVRANNVSRVNSKPPTDRKEESAQRQAEQTSTFSPAMTKTPYETSDVTSLRPYLEDVYKNAPGGLDAAVQLAQQYKPEADKAGLITFTPEQLDKQIPVSSKSQDWARWSAENNGSAAIPSTLAGMTTGTTAAPEILLNPRTIHDQPLSTLRHELSHAAFIPKDHQKLKEHISSADKAAPFMSPLERERWNYASDKSEFLAHLAEAKREYVKETGKQIATPSDAKQVLNFMHSSPKFHFDYLNSVLPKAVKSPDTLQQMLLQILSVVKGNAQPNTGSYA